MQFLEPRRYKDTTCIRTQYAHKNKHAQHTKARKHLRTLTEHAHTHTHTRTHARAHLCSPFHVLKHTNRAREVISETAVLLGAGLEHLLRRRAEVLVCEFQ